MTAALILVILVASGEANSPASQSMLRATGDTLGLQAEVSIHEIDPSLGDDDVIAAGKMWHADAVVRVSWEEGHRHASVHLHGESSARWIDREIGFHASDAEDERGRTVGFALISMLPEGVVPRAPPAPPPAAAPKISPQASETPKKQPDREDPENPDEETPEPPRRWHGAVDALGIGATGVGGDATGFGGAMRGQWFFLPDFSARLGGGARAGSVSALAAKSLTFFGAAGVSWHPMIASKRHPFALGASLDAVAMHYALTRTGTGGVAENEGRWIPAADLTMEGTLNFTEALAVVVDLGGEMTFGQTEVFLAGKEVTTIPPLRAIAEAGLRVRF